MVAEAVRRWKQEEDVVDDITAVVVYINVRAPAASAATEEVSTHDVVLTPHDGDR